MQYFLPRGFVRAGEKEGEIAWRLCDRDVREGIRHSTSRYPSYGSDAGSLTRSLQDSFDMQADAIAPGNKVIVIDDLIATGEPDELG